MRDAVKPGWLRGRWVVALALAVVVSGMTAAARAGLVSVDALAASPHRLARGQVWLLVSNGLLVQRPVLLSLVSLVLLSVVTLYLCSRRVFTVSAFAGHVGSTLLSYSLVTLVWTVRPDSVRGLVDFPDYGVSAIQAAWIGAIAATIWRRRDQTAQGRLLVALGCVAVGAFAWLVRSDLTLLDSDHLFAFAIGASAATAWCSRDLPSPAVSVRAIIRRAGSLVARASPAPKAGWVAPAVAALVGLIALANLQSAASPNIRWRSKLIHELLPHGLPALSHALAVPLSAALLLAAVSLARRRYRAWQASLLFLVALGALDLLKGLAYEQAGFSLAAAAVLSSARSSFHVAPAPGALRSSANLAATIIAGTVVLAAVATWVSLPGAPRFALVLRESRALLLWQTGPVRFRHELSDFPLAINLLSLGGLLSALWVLFRPLRPPFVLPGRASRRRAYRLVRSYGHDTLAFFKLRHDLQYLFSRDREAFLGYRIEQGVLLIAADPVGNPDSINSLLDDARRFSSQRGLQLGALGASEAMLPHYAAAGLRALYLGDEAIVDTTTFSLQGRPIRKVRQSVNRISRLGYQTELRLARELSDAELAELSQVSSTHLASVAERGFAMAIDTLCSADTGDSLLVIARDSNGTIAGFLQYVPSYGRAAVSLAAMHRLPHAPNGLTEYLVSRSIELLREQGVEEVSLNFALLGRYLRCPNTIFERMVAILLRQLSHWFQIESLYRFNAKFFPRWEPRYLIHQGTLCLPATIIAALAAEGQIQRPRLLRLPRGRRSAAPTMP